MISFLNGQRVVVISDTSKIYGINKEHLVISPMSKGDKILLQGHRKFLRRFFIYSEKDNAHVCYIKKEDGLTPSKYILMSFDDGMEMYNKKMYDEEVFVEFNTIIQTLNVEEKKAILGFIKDYRKS